MSEETNDSMNIVPKTAGGLLAVPGLVSLAGDWVALASLFTKISAVTGDIPRIAKNLQNNSQGWKAAGWDDVADAVNESLAKHKLAVVPSQIGTAEVWEVGQTRNGAIISRHKVRVRFILGDGDTGAMMISEWEGFANDFDDKGIDKAFTYTVKSFLKKTFVISTGDERDADRHSYQSPEEGFQPPQQPQAPQQRSPQQKPAAQPKPAAKPAEPAAKPELHEVPKNQPPASQNGSEPPSFQMLAKFAHETLAYEKEDIADILDHFKLVKGKNGHVGWTLEQHPEMLDSLIQWKAFHGIGKEHEREISPAGDWTFESARRWLTSQGIAEPYTSEAIANAIPIFQQYIDMSLKLVAMMPLGEAIKVIVAANIGPWRPEKSDLMIAAVRDALKPAIKDDIAKLTEGLGAAITEVAPIEEVIANGAEPEAEAEPEDLFGDLFGDSQLTL